MPELPEIETIKSVIEPQIQGTAIKNIIVGRPEVIAHPTVDEFCKGVIGQTIFSMVRRGKFLIIHLKNESRIILHLRMTSCLLVTPPDYPKEKHTYIVMQLDKNQRTGLPQHSFFAGVRSQRNPLSQLRKYIMPYSHWRQKYCVLSELSKRLETNISTKKQSLHNFMVFSYV